MNPRLVILVVLSAAVNAHAGGILELVPTEPGPYLPGQSVAVEVWLHNEESFDIDLRLVLLDVQGLRARLFAGGEFVTSGGTTVNHVAKLSGGSWTPLNTGLEDSVFALRSCAVGLGTTLYAGGHVWGAHDWEPTVNRLEAGGWIEIGRGPSGRTLSFLCLNDALGRWLYAGGYLWNFEETEAYGIARWNGGEWSSIAGLNGSVHDMVVFDDGTGAALHVAGNFHCPVPPNPYVWLWGVGKWTGTAWAPLGGGMMVGYEEWGVKALAVFDDGSGPVLYAAGDFRDVYRPETDELLPVNNIAKWDGLAWSAVGGGTTPNMAAPIYDMVVFDDGRGPALYVGGRFTTAGGVSVNNVARWDGASWSDVGGGVTGGVEPAVYALAVLDDGSGPALYAGGRFTDAGGAAVSNVARWDGTSWSPVGAGFDDTVRALAVHEAAGEPNLIIEGNFQFDFSTLADGGSEYRVWPAFPGPLLVYDELGPIEGRMLHVPASGSLRIGEMEVVTPGAPGAYGLDVADPYGPRGGSILAFGFGGPDDPLTYWSAAEGGLTGDSIPLNVQTGPSNAIPALSEWGIAIMTLMLLTVGTILLPRHRDTVT